MAVRNRLPRALTLKSRVEVDALLKKGRRLSGQYCTLVWQASDDFRYTILVRKKDGPAHVRNRIKRLFREGIRLGRTGLDLKLRCAIFPRVTEQESAKSIQDDVSQLFRRIDQRSH